MLLDRSAMLLDTHFHLGFLPESLQEPFLGALAERNVRVIGQTLLPSEFAARAGAFADTETECEAHPLAESDSPANGEAESQPGSEARKSPAPQWSMGFHPWNIESDDQAERELAVFREHLHTTRCIGEIGLDFYPKRLETTPAALQEYVFQAILQSIADAAASGDTDALPFVLSIHCVRSASKVLEMLEDSGCASGNVVPVLHRFGGTSDELMTLIALGGCISVHPQMLETKRGRAYVAQVPADRLLLETDLPPSPFSTTAGLAAKETLGLALNVAHQLHSLVEQIGSLRAEEFLPQLLSNQRRLYGR